MKYSKHYSKDYFSWQSSIGEFGGWANDSKFKKNGWSKYFFCKKR